MPWMYTVLVIAVAGAAVAVAWLLSRNVPHSLSYLEPDPAPVTVRVEAATLDHRSSATLTATYESPRALLASGRSGTVTAVTVDHGDVLSTGDVVYEVDGTPVVAYVNDVVFYRPLTRGSEGEDVAAAQELLNAVVPATSLVADGRFGVATEEAVRIYERSLGIERPTGVFDPAWFVRVPHLEFTIADLTLIAGQPAPGRADQIGTGAPVLASVAIVTTTSPPDGAYQFTHQGRALPVTRADGAWGVDVADAGALLGATPPEAGTADIDGVVRLVDGLPGQAVPPSALIDDAESSSCVAIVEGRGFKLREVQVLTSDTAGAALIHPELPPDAEVLVNPHAIGERSCP